MSERIVTDNNGRKYITSEQLLHARTYSQTELDAAVAAEHERIKAALLTMHERDKERHNYWAFAARELFGDGG